MDIEKEQCNRMDIQEEPEPNWNNPMAASHVGYQLQLLDRMFRKRMIKSMKEDEYDGVTIWGNWVLEYLDLKGDEVTCQKDIEQNFHTGKSTIAGIMKTLEKNGLIVRKAVEGDARLKQICITERGTRYVQNIKQKREDMEKLVTKGLSEKDMEDFFRIIKKMQENLC